MFYPDELIEQVREANDIVDVVGTYVRLNHRGSHYVGLCPFHNEKTGSFSVNKNMQIYKCFGCGKAGNVFTFLMEYDNLTFIEAVKELANRAGIALPEVEMSEEEKQRRNLRERILEINKDAATFYYVKLRSPEGKHAYEYLSGRGLDDETMKKFGLGYAGRYSDELYAYLKSKHYTDEQLKASGLFSFTEKGASDKFWNRAMFPIMDKRGKVIAFGGRIMGEAQNAPKYLNSPETKVFLKGENLYALNIARHSSRKYLLLCEGYMDVISLHQAGFDNAVASLGTALTPRQAKLISNIVTDVVITYDNDEAGCKAILRAIPILKEAGITARVINMTGYKDREGGRFAKDPDEFIKTFGAEAYQHCIDTAFTAFEFETSVMRGGIDANDPAQKTSFDHAIAKKLARITDEIERNNYIEATARSYNIDHAALTRLVNKYGREAYDEAVAEETVERDRQQRKNMPTAKDGPVRTEQLAVSFIANNASYYEASKGMITQADFADPLCNKLAGIVFSLYEAGDNVVHAKIINHFEEVTDQEKVAEILDASLYEENINEKERHSAFADLLVRICTASIDRSWQQAVADNDAPKLQELMSAKSRVATLRTALLKKL